MRILDRIILNRIIAMVLGFIVAMLKIFMPKDTGTVDPEVDPEVQPVKRPIIDRIKKIRKKKTDE